MTKFKHNKKKNTAFLYEASVLELTRAILNKDEVLQKKILKLIKESFLSRSAMRQELKLYHTITHIKGISPLMADKLLAEAKRQHSLIDKKRLYSEQNNFNREIMKLISKNVFSNFVPSYKDLASISQIFNKKASIKTRILLENEIIEKMSSGVVKEEKMVPIDNIIFKSFIKRFNGEYGEKLLKEQKSLLNKFISSFLDNGIELKIYLNEEIGRLKKELNESLGSEILNEDSEMKTKTKQTLDLLESYKEKSPNKKMVEEIIKIQALVHEIKSNDD